MIKSSLSLLLFSCLNAQAAQTLTSPVDVIADLKGGMFVVAKSLCLIGTPVETVGISVYRYPSQLSTDPSWTQTFCPGTTETIQYVSATYNTVVNTFYFGYYVNVQARTDYLLRSINDDDPSSAGEPLAVFPSEVAAPGILKTFTEPNSRNASVLLLAKTQLFQLSNNNSIANTGFGIRRQFQFNIGNSAISMEIVRQSAVIVGVNVPSGVLPPGTPAAFGNYVASVPLVNDADRWRGELLNPSTSIGILNSALVQRISTNASVVMRTSPVIVCGDFTYIILNGVSNMGAAVSAEVFVYSSFPLRQIARKSDVIPASDHLVSATCIDSPTAKPNFNGILILVKAAIGTQPYTLLVDNTSKVYPKKVEEEFKLPGSPSSQFVVASIQTLDKEYFTRVMFAYDTQQQSTNQGALFGFYDVKSDLLVKMLDFIGTPQVPCPANFYTSSITAGCVPCDASSAMQAQCTVKGAIVGTQVDTPLPVKVALAILIPFLFVLIICLTYGYWKRHGGQFYKCFSEGKDGDAKSSDCRLWKIAYKIPFVPFFKPKHETPRKALPSPQISSPELISSSALQRSTATLTNIACPAKIASESESRSPSGDSNTPALALDTGSENKGNWTFMAHEVLRVRDSEKPAKRVGSAELEQLINSLNDDYESRNSGFSKTLSITPSWNYAAEGPADQSTNGEYNPYIPSSKRLGRVPSTSNQSIDSSKHRVSFGISALTPVDFETGNRLHTRPPPPAPATFEEQNGTRHRRTRSNNESSVPPIVGAPEKKYSWATSGASDDECANGGKTTSRNHATPRRTNTASASHMSVSPKLSMFGGREEGIVKESSGGGIVGMYKDFWGQK